MWLNLVLLVESYLENCTKDKRKPAHDGICILELSTVLIHDFHYGYELKKYGGKQSYYLLTEIVWLMSLTCIELNNMSLTNNVHSDFYVDFILD